MSPKKKMAVLTLHGSNVVPIPMSKDVGLKTIMLEDLFLKKSQEKMVEATPLFELVNSSLWGMSGVVIIDSYKTLKETQTRLVLPSPKVNTMDEFAQG